MWDDLSEDSDETILPPTPGMGVMADQIRRQINQALRILEYRPLEIPYAYMGRVELHHCAVCRLWVPRWQREDHICSRVHLREVQIQARQRPRRPGQQREVNWELRRLRQYWEFNFAWERDLGHYGNQFVYDL